jgi:hypothetical protein
MKSLLRYCTLTFFAVLFAAACQKTESVETKQAEPAYFPASDVCNYPAAGPGKVFINLSGGKWARSNPLEAGSSFECTGVKSSVQLVSSGSSLIEVQYVATGVEKGSSLISLTYIATGSGPVPNESTYRNAFANLVDAVSRQGLGAAPPDLFKKKLSNLSSYSQPGKGFTENFDVGKGFVSLTREAAPNSEIKVYVKLFPDVSLKLEG